MEGAGTPGGTGGRPVVLGAGAGKAGWGFVGKSMAPSILWDALKSLPGSAVGSGEPEPAARHPPDGGQGPGFQPRLGSWSHHPAANGQKKRPSPKNAEQRAQERPRELAPARRQQDQPGTAPAERQLPAALRWSHLENQLLAFGSGERAKLSGEGAVTNACRPSSCPCRPPNRGDEPGAARPASPRAAGLWVHPGCQGGGVRTSGAAVPGSALGAQSRADGHGSAGEQRVRSLVPSRRCALPPRAEPARQPGCCKTGARRRLGGTRSVLQPRGAFRARRRLVQAPRRHFNPGGASFPLEPGILRLERSAGSRRY